MGRDSNPSAAAGVAGRSGYHGKGDKGLFDAPCLYRQLDCGGVSSRGRVVHRRKDGTVLPAMTQEGFPSVMDGEFRKSVRRAQRATDRKNQKLMAEIEKIKAGG